MGESNNGIIWRALRRIYTIVGAVLGVVILLVDKFTQYIPEKYFLQAVLGAVILFLVGIVISAYFEGKKTIRLEEHQKKVLDLKGKHQKDLEDKIANIRRQIAEEHQKKVLDLEDKHQKDLEDKIANIRRQIAEEHQKKVLDLEDKHQKDLEDKIANIRRQIVEPYPKNKFVDKEILSYVDVAYAIDELIGDIKSKGFEPDIIIGIDRGGAIVGGMLAKYRGNPLTTISSSPDWTISSSEKSLDDGIKDSTKNIKKNILLVDDACRRGRTMKKAHVVLVDKCKFRELKTATILNVEEMPHKEFIPDFFVYKTNRAGTMMPWDKEK